MKKRLVGAVVLVALAVIFVPMLLEEGEPPVESVDLEREIPQEPSTDYRMDLIPTEEEAREADTDTTMEIPLETITEPDRPESVTPDETATAPGETGTAEADKEQRKQWVIVEDAAKSADKTTSTARVESAGTGGSAGDTRTGWAVQAGSFGQKTNAESLMADLKLNGMNAYISEVQVADKTLYRVRIGPLENKQSAEQQLQLVEKNFKLKGTILAP
ncbi:MAG: SPOR domain-containing protein [Gammaproteobacteria bacterium]|jgi:DedD protein